MSNILKRTHMCGELRREDIGKEVCLNGWVQKSRDKGGLVFCDLRDRTGIVQAIFEKGVSSDAALEKATTLRSEFVVGIKGTVKEREAKNKDMATGDIEIFVTDLVIYSEADTPPIYIKDDDNVDENLRLKYRYLDLRKLKMQQNLMFRHKLAQATRQYFDQNGFVEIETPILVNPTPEGARDYMVPSRVNPGKFFALPQSPQQFKQMLMLSGFDRYMQIARCFRDEDLRADRQPEFTQIDLEMSFVDVDDVIEMLEGYVKHVFGGVMNHQVSLPLQRITYDEAMTRYGSDKPDTRFGFELKHLNHVVKGCEFSVFASAIEAGGDVRGININGCAEKFGRKDLDKFQDAIKAYRAKGLAWIKVTETEVTSPIAKFFSEEKMKEILTVFDAKPGDLILMVADKPDVVFDALGFLRRDIAGKLGMLDNKQYNLLWVTDFPLYEYSEEDDRYYAKHHPFTSPRMEDIPLMDTNPIAVKAKAYDLVLNGFELGGGSIRIHDKDLQRKMFKTLGLSEEEIEEKFGFMINAFRYGTPPHGGLALGLDRLAMLLCGAENIREVIAFPKNQAATCLLTGAPGPATDAQMNELYIKSIASKE